MEFMYFQHPRRDPLFEKVTFRCSEWEPAPPRNPEPSGMDEYESYPNLLDLTSLPQTRVLGLGLEGRP